MLLILGGILSLVGFVGWLFIIIHAFKSSVGQGFLSLCVPFYILYYAFAKFEHSKKGLIIALFLGGYILGGVMYQVGAMQAARALTEGMQNIKIEVPAAPK